MYANKTTMYKDIKCKNCRKNVLSNPSFVDIENHTTDEINSCEPCVSDSLLFISEDSLPEKIKNKIEDANWTKGRINCENCGTRLGGFDFISGTKCSCTSNVSLPPVHFIKSKLDLIK